MQLIRSSVISLLLCLASSATLADMLDLVALTCSGDVSVGARWKELERLGRPVADGSFILEQQFTFEALCVERVTVTAAFGTLVVTGSVCDAKPQPLLDFVRARSPELAPVAENSLNAGSIIASYRSPTRSFALFKGRVTLTEAPDPTSREVSYMCSFQASGTQ